MYKNIKYIYTYTVSYKLPKMSLEIYISAQHEKIIISNLYNLVEHLDFVYPYDIFVFVFFYTEMAFLFYGPSVNRQKSPRKSG